MSFFREFVLKNNQQVNLIIYTILSTFVAVILYGVLHSTGAINIQYEGVNIGEIGGAIVGFVITIRILLDHDEKIRHQETLLTGNVIFGETRLPVPNASVMIMGTNLQTSTDGKGSFSIRVPDKTSWKIHVTYGEQVKEKEVTKGSIEDIEIEIPSKKVTGKVNFEILNGIRGENWTQTLENDHKKIGTSLYIPLKFINNSEKNVTLYDVQIKDLLSGKVLKPPETSTVEIGNTTWFNHYQACGYHREYIFNSGDTDVQSLSTVNKDIMIKENDVHREEYNVKITFKDNFGNSYEKILPLIIKELAWEKK